MASAGPWLTAFPLADADADPRTRLFCFPHAGGGSHAYRAWPQGAAARTILTSIGLGWPPSREAGAS